MTIYTPDNDISMYDMDYIMKCRFGRVHPSIVKSELGAYVESKSKCEASHQASKDAKLEAGRTMRKQSQSRLTTEERKLRTRIANNRNNVRLCKKYGIRLSDRQRYALLSGKSTLMQVLDEEQKWLWRKSSHPDKS